MDVKLLQPVYWLGTKENMRRIQTQRNIIKPYTVEQKKQLVSALKNTYRVDQVVTVLKKRIHFYANQLYKHVHDGTLTSSIKKSLSYKLRINRIIAGKMDIEGHPINSDPFYKPNVDNGKFARDLYHAIYDIINNQLIRKHITWIKFLQLQGKVRLNEFPNVAKDFQTKFIHAEMKQAKQNMRKSSIIYRLFTRKVN